LAVLSCRVKFLAIFADLQIDCYTPQSASVPEEVNDSFSGCQKIAKFVGTVLKTLDHAFSKTFNKTIRNPEILGMCQ
jgi:hypothetical protein